MQEFIETLETLESKEGCHYKWEFYSIVSRLQGMILCSHCNNWLNVTCFPMVFEYS